MHSLGLDMYDASLSPGVTMALLWRKGLRRKDTRHARHLLKKLNPQKRAEDALKEAHAQLNATLQAMPDLMFETDRDGRIADYHASKHSELYVEPEVFLGKTFADVLPEEVASVIAKGLAIAGEKGLHKGGTYRLDLPSGPEHYELSIAAKGENPRLADRFVVLARNITDRERANERLQAAKDYTEKLIQVANAVIVGLDCDGRVTLFNQAAETITGYTKEEVQGRDWYELPIHKDKPVHDWAELTQSIEEDGSASFETLIVTKDGKTRIIAWRNRVIRENNICVGMICFGADISERRELEAQLRQAQKLEALGRLAGGVAHDFNNLLTAILGNCDLVDTTLHYADPARRDIAEIRLAGQRAAALTQQLLAFSRKQILQTQVLDLGETVQKLYDMLSRLLGEDVIVEVRHMGGPACIKADPGQVHQVLLNLAVNARDAMPKGGKLVIQTESAVCDEAVTSLHMGMNPGSYVLLTVSDTGCGMDSTIQEHIFEPFFTTKEVGKGTGLGLATVHGVVKQSGGFISVQSAVNEGSTFRVYFPSVQKESIRPSVPLALNHGELATETVLVVEDSDQVRRLLVRTLQSGGYRVLQASCGDAAISLCAHETGLIHLLLTDVVMPGMSGYDLAKHLARLRPDMSILYMSGYTENTADELDIVSSNHGWIQKPFELDELATKVRESLRRTP